MTKNNKIYEPRPRDFWPTPEKAVLPLLGHLPKGFTFCEPCAGNGALIDHLEKHFEATCFAPLDIEPQQHWITRGDAINLNEETVEYCDCIITNPPFTWKVLKPLLDVWIPLKETILLLPADFIHNQRFAPYLEKCVKIISVGRVKWIEDSKTSGVENYIWAFFNFNKDPLYQTEFFGRSDG